MLNKNRDNVKIISTGITSNLPEQYAVLRKGDLMKNCKKTLIRCYLSLALCFSIIFGSAAVNVSAQIIPTESEQFSEPLSRAAEKNVKIVVNSKEYKGAAFILNSSTYVGVREFSLYMGAKSVSWNSSTKTAAVKSDSLSLTAKNNDTYIIANGRYLWAKNGIIIRDGTMYAPLRTLAKAFGCSVSWNAKEYRAHLSGKNTLKNGAVFYDGDSVLWLSRIIHAEAKGEPLLGKVAVGTVVLNRVKSRLYPNTIYGVIFDKKNGIQFTPASNGTVYCKPSAESIIAAKLCLDGASISDKVLFFLNEAIAESSWITDNRKFVVAVGNHKFYA